MKILFSPSKTMHLSTLPSETTPLFLPQAQAIQDALTETLKTTSLEQFYKCSEKKAQDIAPVLKNFSLLGTSPALYSFSGLAFHYLHPQSLDQWASAYLKDHLLIFSGLYGFLRAFDGINPYRLDYENPLKIEGQSLKAYWKEPLYTFLKGEDLILNLASKEYATSLLSYKDLKLVTIDFKLKQGDKLLSRGTEAKIARGELLRLLALSHAESEEDVIALCPYGYRYSHEQSEAKNLVFIKKID